MAFLIQISRSNGGLPKRAVAGPVMLTDTGIEGDRQRNLRLHGGPRKAVLMISAEIVDELASKAYPVIPGSLGENLTVSGLDAASWRMGQRYRIGEDAVIELTTPRKPCGNLDIFGPLIKNELYDARGGFYARIVHTGLLIAGAPVTLESNLA